MCRCCSTAYVFQPCGTLQVFFSLLLYGWLPKPRGFSQTHRVFPLNVSDCFCYFMRGSSPCKLTCLWTATNTRLFYLLVSQSFTMLSREPEISWCSWVGDHFTDVTQPVWEVRDRRTKEPSEWKEVKAQTLADAKTSTLKMHTKSSPIAVQVKC